VPSDHDAVHDSAPEVSVSYGYAIPSSHPVTLLGGESACQTTVTELVYHSAEHWCVPAAVVHIGVIASPHATEAPINVTATATSAPTNTSRLIAVPIS
jgi:hypothetical protein